MKLHLQEIEYFPANVTVEADPGSFGLNHDGVCSVSSVKAELSVQSSDDEYFCQGTVKATITFECVRCLGQFDKDVAQETDFIVCSKQTFEEKRKEADDDEAYVFYAGHSLTADLTDITREALILSVALMPICSEDCLGLCPSCGVNKNKTECDCTDDKIDERWEGLRGLSEKE